MSLPTFQQLIAKKRDGQELSQRDIQLFVDGVTKKTMMESQIGAMLMAVYQRDMTLGEASHLTRAMMNSGTVLKWPAEWKGRVVDKHSTGGVGDKISLALAPALAACDLKVPMISGRGLMHTGGTLDKLEAIPGYTVNQSAESMKQILDTVGCCIVGQTEEMVPADKQLYSTRDVTATVDCIPLIVGSIVSKKGAEGLDSLLLDVKTGKGAVMQIEKEARQLAADMVSVGQALGMNMTSFLTSMDRPTGYMVGNALEIVETLDCLKGGGPESTLELVTKEGGCLLHSVGKAVSREEGEKMIDRVLKDGSALLKFREMLKGQGVSASNADKLCTPGADVFSVLPQAKHKTDIPAKSSGYVGDINAMKVAMVSYRLGAGRTNPGDSLDHAVGLQLRVALADPVTEGKPWITVHHNRDLPAEYVTELQDSLIIAPTAPQCTKSIVIDIFPNTA